MEIKTCDTQPALCPSRNTKLRRSNQATSSHPKRLALVATNRKTHHRLGIRLMKDDLRAAPELRNARLAVNAANDYSHANVITCTQAGISVTVSKHTIRLSPTLSGLLDWPSTPVLDAT